MKVDGHCHCGLIAYEAEIDPNNVMICHCTDCQSLSGSAFRTVAFTSENGFRLLSGTLKTYVKTGDSGTKRVQSFCPECGSPIYSAPISEEPKVYSIRVGTIRQRDQLSPKMQLWRRSSQPWLVNLGAVPAIETQSAFSGSGGMT